MSMQIATYLRSNVLGLVAIFIALTGTAVALPGKNKVDSGDIINGQVKKADLKNLAVKRAKLGPDAVDSSKVVDGTISRADLGTNSVGTLEVVNDSLTGLDVDEAQLLHGGDLVSNVANAQIAANAVGSAEVAPDSLGGADVFEPSLTGITESFLSDDGTCNPNSTSFQVCAAQGAGPFDGEQALAVGTVSWFSDIGGARGTCELRQSGSRLSSVGVGETLSTTNETHLDQATLIAVTDGDVDGVQLRCNELESDIRYVDARVALVGG